MGDPFIIKQGDTSPNWGVTLSEGVDADTGEGGEPADISAVDTMRFLMRSKDRDDVLAVDNDADISWDTESSDIEYDWQDGDTDGPVGHYLVEVEATFLDGKVQTFPSVGYWIVDIADDLDVT